MNNIYYNSNTVFFTRLQNLISNQLYTYSCTFKNINKDLGEWIYISIPVLQDKKYTWATRCYWILNGLQDFPACNTCGKKIIKNVNSLNLGYHSHFKLASASKYIYYCSHKCAMKNQHVKKQRLHTTQLHYNVDYPMQSTKIQKKVQDYFQKKYGKGIVNPRQAPEVIEKCIQQKRLHFNGSTLSDSAILKLRKLASSAEFQDKTKRSCQAKYNVDYPFQNKNIREKARTACFKNNGYYYPIELAENRQKFRNKYYYKNIKFDSSWELAFYIWLEDHNYKFKYQCKFLNLTYYDNSRKLRKYIPDFYLEDFDIIVEIKGNQFFKNNLQLYKNQSWKEKYECILKNNVVIFKYNEIKDFLIYVKYKYGKNYLKSFKYESFKKS